MKSWRDVIAIHPAAELLPRMSPNELQVLGEDIKRHGLKVPIVIFKELIEPGTPESGYKYSLLDGISRLDAMEAVGMHVSLELKKGRWRFTGTNEVFLPTPRTVSEKDIGDPYVYAISANIHRRHLTTEKRLETAEKLTKARQDLSARQVAKLAKVSPTTAVKIRNKLEASGDVSTVDTSTDTIGRRQPRQKPKKPGNWLTEAQKQVGPGLDELDARDRAELIRNESRKVVAGVMAEAMARGMARRQSLSRVPSEMAPPSPEVGPGSAVNEVQVPDHVVSDVPRTVIDGEPVKTADPPPRPRRSVPRSWQARPDWRSPGPYWFRSLLPREGGPIRGQAR